MDSPEYVPVHNGRLDRSHELIIVQIVFVILSGICVLIRGYIKCFIIRVNLLDDYLLYGAMVTYVAYSAIVIDDSYKGATGRHPSLDLPMERNARSLRTWYITMLIYPWIGLVIRASICVMLARINTKRSYLWLIRVVFAINVLFSVAFFFVLVFQCSPPRYFWRQVYGSSGHCYDRNITNYSTTVYSAICALCDWFLGLLPIAILWSVQINLRTKMVIAGLLSLGVIAGIAPIVRTTYVTRAQPGLRFLYEATDVAIWSVMEPALGIIASCVASYRPLFKGCGFGWSSFKGRTTVYALSEEQHRRDAFTSSNKTRAAGLGPEPFDAISDDGKLDGSEHELTIRHDHSA